MIARVKLHFRDQGKLMWGILWGKYPSEREVPTALMRCVMLLLVLLRCISIGQVFKHLGRHNREKNQVIDCYVFVAISLLVTCLYRCPKSGFAFWVATYLMLEMFVTTLAVVLVDKYTERGIRSPERSVVLLGIGYLELITGFAILYLYCDGIGFSGCWNRVTLPTHALYFSTVTITTLGYGDITPANDVGRSLVVCETLAGLAMILYALSVFILSTKPLEKYDDNPDERNNSRGEKLKGKIRGEPR